MKFLTLNSNLNKLIRKSVKRKIPTPCMHTHTHALFGVENLCPWWSISLSGVRPWVWSYSLYIVKYMLVKHVKFSICISYQATTPKDLDLRLRCRIISPGTDTGVAAGGLPQANLLRIVSWCGFSWFPKLQRPFSPMINPSYHDRKVLG